MTVKKIPKINVSRAFKELSTPEIITFALGTKFTGDADATDPIHDDAEIEGFAGDLQDTHSLRQISKSTALTNQEHSQFNTLSDALDDNASYTEIIANKVVKETGDINNGYNVVTRLGFLYTNKGGGKRNIGFINSGTGWLHAYEAKTLKGLEGHLWEHGTTLAKGTPPTITKKVFTLECDCIFNNIPSGTVFAYRHASIVPVSHIPSSSTSATPKSAKGKTASLVTKSKANHPVFDVNVDNPYQYGDWRYSIVP